MGILDGMISSKAELERANEYAAPIVEFALDRMKFSPKTQSVIELMKQGLSLGDILGITKEQRDALFAHACRLLQHREIQKARDFLQQLYQIEPLEARTIYALAGTFQMEGDYARAGKLYVNFLALDATNPDGFLRLGECFLGAKEFGEAVSAFEMAEIAARRDPAKTAQAAVAAKMVALAKQRLGTKKG